jgi:hypothetical protein
VVPRSPLADDERFQQFVRLLGQVDQRLPAFILSCRGEKTSAETAHVFFAADSLRPGFLLLGILRVSLPVSAISGDV